MAVRKKNAAAKAPRTVSPEARKAAYERMKEKRAKVASANARRNDAFMAIGSAGSVIFATAARLALPVTVAMMVSNAGLGLLGRAIPQLNLMTLQLPAHVALLPLLVAFGARELVDHMAAILLPWMENLSPVMAGGR